MAKSLEASYGVTYKLRCTHCRRDQNIASIKDLDLGMVIRPAPGGRGYGVCVFCRKPGLTVIDKILSDRVQ